MTIHDILAARHQEVMQRWRAQVEGTLAPQAMPPIELIDHLPEFLQEILGALRDDAGLDSSGPSPHDSTTAGEHGDQRLRLGFSLDSVVREYGALQDAIIATVREAGVSINFRELQVVFDCVISGIAHAVSEYARQRDAELTRQANEHFAFIAHELRNPLSTAKMAFEILKQKGQLPADDRAAGALERGLQSASELINQTLQISRVASGIELRRQWTTLGILCEDAESAASAEADSKGVDLHCDTDCQDRIDVDVRLIRSALGNLVRNAVKFTPTGGAVELRAHVTSGRAVLEVEDSCGGLPPGKVEEAFAPFVRLDNEQPGFGLGLAIAKQAADAHGGTIRIQNLPGKGCVFVLELPVVTEQAAEQPTE
jgi:hypothetical protein